MVISRHIMLHAIFRVTRGGMSLRWRWRFRPICSPPKEAEEMFAGLIAAVQDNHQHKHQQGQRSDQHYHDFGRCQGQADRGMNVSGSAISAEDTGTRREAPPDRCPRPGRSRAQGRDAFRAAVSSPRRLTHRGTRFQVFLRSRARPFTSRGHASTCWLSTEFSMRRGNIPPSAASAQVIVPTTSVDPLLVGKYHSPIRTPASPEGSCRR